MEGLLVSLITGGIGGNVAGALLKGKSLGMLWNTVVGVLGGGVGSQILGTMDILQGGMVGNIAGSTVGGALLLVIVSFFKKK